MIKTQDNNTVSQGDYVFMATEKFSMLWHKVKVTKRIEELSTTGIYVFKKNNPYPKQNYIKIKYFKHPSIGKIQNDKDITQDQYGVWVVSYLNYPGLYYATSFWNALMYKWKFIEHKRTKKPYPFKCDEILCNTEGLIDKITTNSSNTINILKEDNKDLSGKLLKMTKV